MAPDHLDAVTLKIRLRTSGHRLTMERWMDRVYECDGETDHLLWEPEGPGPFASYADSALVSQDAIARYADLVADLRSPGVRRISAVRRALVG